MDSLTPALELKQFAFSYPSGGQVFAPLNLELQPGTFTLLEGATGCGKTTLLRCCKPEIAPEGNRSGSILLFGEAVEHMPSHTSAQTIGYVAQNPESQLVCESVWHELAFGLENLGIPNTTMKRRVAEVAHFFGMESWFHRKTAHLSGGMQQMLNLASVLVMAPRIILLDEPTAQLDPVAEKNFLHALFRINKELGITLVVASHQPEVMRAYASQEIKLQSTQKVTEHAHATSGFFKTKSKNPKPAICLDDAYVRYESSAPFVLKGTTLAITQGEIHAIVGGNGSGKSTLINTIAGIQKPQRGSIHNQMQNSQALLPQNPKALFVCDSVLEELSEWQSSCCYAAEDINNILSLFGLNPYKNQHPYDLSGGQQQLLALAKLLLTNPSLLLLDEPTKGLDAAAKSTIAQALRHAASTGTTILFATHDLAFAKYVAHNTSMLFDGEIVCTEPSELFFENNLFYRPAFDEFSKCYQKTQSPSNANPQTQTAPKEKSLLL